MARYAFILQDTYAITVEPFVVLDPHSGDEHGARIQVRRIEDSAEPGTHLGAPLWRGDLFHLTAGPSGNWDRAHFHPRFNGLEAGSRNVDPQLSKDPIDWALTQLSDLHSLATRAGASDLAAVSAELQPQVDAIRDEIQVALQKCAATPPPTRTPTN